MKRRTPLRVHVFWDSGHQDYRGERICTCGSVERATVHAVQEREEQEREIEARRVGERD